MSDPPPLPGRRPSGAITALMVLAGVILLLPGLCAGIFVLDAATRPEGLGGDAMFMSLWLTCFAIAAGGIVLIWRAVRRMRT